MEMGVLSLFFCLFLYSTLIEADSFKDRSDLVRINLLARANQTFDVLN